MAFQLPELPFSKDALTPFLSPETFDYHHGKHHAAYVNNANGLVADTPYDNMTLEAVIRTAAAEKATGLFNNAAQIWNHTFFWNCMSPSGGGAPGGRIGELITRDFGTFDAFKKQFTKAAVTLFGSGWAWLTVDESGSLELLQLSNADTPIVHNKTALLTIDVWEHAYYIDYRNARPKFVEGFWDVVNWQHVNDILG
ncbi:MAG: superoxide dismutase [Bacteroidetes bacterium]|nr:superoxide dismutase [Bacteroidota bacterium]